MEFNARLPAAPARARCFLHPQASLLWCRKKILQAWKMLLEGSDCPPDTSSPPSTAASHRRTLHRAVNHLLPSGVLQDGGDFHLPSDLLKLRPSFMGTIKVIF